MWWIGCVHCEKLWCDFVVRTSSLVALVQFVLHQVSCSNKTNPKCTQTVWKQTNTWVLGPMGWIGCVRCEKFQCDLMAQTFPLIAPVLHQVSCSNETLTNAPKHYENAPKQEFRVQWVDRVRLLPKIPMGFRGTNFCINCTNSAYFASSFMQ